MQNRRLVTRCIEHLARRKYESRESRSTAQQAVPELAPYNEQEIDSLFAFENIDTTQPDWAEEAQCLKP